MEVEKIDRRKGPRTEEIRQRISNSHKMRDGQHPNTLKALADAQEARRGKKRGPLSEEHRQLISDKMKGRKQTPEHTESIRLSRMKNNLLKSTS